MQICELYLIFLINIWFMGTIWRIIIDNLTISSFKWRMYCNRMGNVFRA